MTAVLFARADSIYKNIPGCDVYDKERDALIWPGGGPVVAHPPCRAWGRLRKFAKPEPGERELAIWAVERVREWGGVLEHPLSSSLWSYFGIENRPLDLYGGWLLALPQFWFGHRAEKWTGFYICGCKPDSLPEIPFILGDAPRVIASSRKRQQERYRIEVTKREREATPEILGYWLVDVAQRCAAARSGADRRCA